MSRNVCFGKSLCVAAVLMVASGCQPGDSSVPPTDSTSSNPAATGLGDTADGVALEDDIGEVRGVASEAAGDGNETDTVLSQSFANKETQQMDKIALSEAEWKKRLSAQQFYVTRQHGTERAFTGEYWDNKRDGVYKCVCCGQPLFDATTKYESGTGWPSFFQPIDDSNVGTTKDNKLFYTRIEVHCSRCDAHLGHVFDDGPAPTGQRFCINSAALKFDERPAAEQE